MKLVIIQNIYTPYRNYLYNSLKEYKIDLNVYYQSKSESGRNWKFDYNAIKYPYIIDRYGVYFKLGKYHVHLNPYLIFKILKLDSSYEVILQGWDDINTMFLCFLKRMKLVKAKLSISCEANYLDKDGPIINKGIKNEIKKFVIETLDGHVIVPGKMPKLALKHFGINTDNIKYALLPNIIEENKFIERIEYKQNHIPIFITPARLIEDLKGILNFFIAIGEVNIRKCQFIIAGDGKDMDIYKEFITKNNLNENISLIGFIDSSSMNALYSKADCLLLPSYYDPSPLSLVEATRIGLPILASNHCGNHFECIIPSQNGEVFDPCSPEDIKENFEKFLRSQKKWKQYSDCSKQIFKTKFEKSIVLKKFIEDLSK